MYWQWLGVVVVWLLMLIASFLAGRNLFEAESTWQLTAIAFVLSVSCGLLAVKLTGDNWAFVFVFGLSLLLGALVYLLGLAVAEETSKTTLSTTMYLSKPE